MLVLPVFKLLFGCAAVMAALVDLPARRNFLSSLDRDQLMAYVVDQPGMEFLKEPDNFPSYNITRIHPDILEDSMLLTHELIRKYGYVAEVHSVTTSDGFVLEIHRIPGGKAFPPREGKTVVYLQHGILDTSAGWLLMGPHHGLAYMLADIGYDVWLGNLRGNRYSRQHIKLNPDGGRKSRRQFWSFTWHEMGLIDLPAIIDYITEITGQNRMHYIGHSQGSTSFFVLMSERQEYNAKIISMNALAPIAYLGNLRSPFVRSAAFFLNTVDMAFSVLGMYEFLPSSRVLAALGKAACSDEALFQFVCSNVLFLIGGFNSKQLNYTMLPVIMGHSPAGASVDQIIHYGQSIRSSKFRQFDHGVMGNVLAYGNIWPPSYKLRDISAPVALHYSLNDFLAEPVDVEQLFSELGNVVGGFVTPDPSFNHFDFLWAVDARELVYNQVLDVMRRFE